MVVSVSRQRKVTYSTLTANLCILGAHVRTATQEGSAIVTLMPARWMVSRVTQVLNALTCRRQLMLLDTHVDPVQPVLPETVLSVRVGGIEVHLCITKFNLHRKPSSSSSSSSSSSTSSSPFKKKLSFGMVFFLPKSVKRRICLNLSRLQQTENACPLTILRANVQLRRRVNYGRARDRALFSGPPASLVENLLFNLVPRAFRLKNHCKLITFNVFHVKLSRYRWMW